MKRYVLPIALILCGVAGVVVWPMAARMRENERRSAVQSNLKHPATSSFTSMKGTPQWNKNNATFQTGKKSSAAIFGAATRVETFRLFPASPKEKAKTSVRGFPVFAQSAPLDGSFGRKLGAVLLRPESYVLPGQGIKQCYFEPGVALRVWNGSKSVDAIICFGCNQLGVVENDPKVPVRSIGGSLSERMNVLGDFDPARAELLALAKEAFASDEAVQAIR